MNRRTKDQILVYGSLTIAGVFLLAGAIGLIAFGGKGALIALAIMACYFIARSAR